MDTKFKIGDLVHWNDEPHVHFIIEEVDKNGWIWHSGIEIPYLDDDIKNYQSPYGFRKLILSKQLIRNKKLEELGI